MSFTVITVDHPIEDRNPKTYTQETSSVLCVKDVVEQYSIWDKPFVVLNGLPLDKDFWTISKIHDGDQVVISPDPGFLGFATWAAFGTFLVQTAITVAIGFLVGYVFGKVFGVDAPEDKGGETGQSYSWKPRTTAREGVPIPVAYGTNMHHGNMVSKWTAVSGEQLASYEEVLYCKVALFEGVSKGIDTGQVYVNDQAVGDFEGVSVVSTTGTLTQEAMEGFEQEKIEIQINKTLEASSEYYIVALPHTGFDDIEWTMEMPRGAWSFNKLGETDNHNMVYNVDYAEVGGENWSAVSTSFGMGTDNINITFRPVYQGRKFSDYGITLDNTKHYKVRFRRTSPSYPLNERSDEINVKSIRGVMNIAFRHPGMTMLGLVALATSSLNTDLDIKVVHNDKVLYYYNGTAWAITDDPAICHNRAWVEYNKLLQPTISGTAVGNYEVEYFEGFQPSQLDTSFFYDWAIFCNQQVPDGEGSTENMSNYSSIHDVVEELWKGCSQSAALGRAHLYIRGTTITGWIEEPYGGAGDLICHQNIVEGSWKQEWTQGRELATVCTVTFQDSSRGYRRLPWPVGNGNATNYTKSIAIEGLGVKTIAHANRIGNFILERNRLINEVDTFEMYKDALLYDIGSVHPIQHRKPKWGTGYKVVSPAGSGSTILHLDRTAEGTAGDSVYIRSYSTSTGNVSTETYSLASISDSDITLTTGLSVGADTDNIVAIGSSTEIKLRRIIGVTQTPNHRFQITVETYDPDLFDVDSVEPGIPYPEFVPSNAENKILKPTTNWQVQNRIASMMPPQPSVDIPWMSNIDWEVDSSGSVVWFAADGSSSMLFRYRDDTYKITPDSYALGSGEDPVYFYWDPNFTTSFLNTLDLNTALAKGKWVVAIYRDGEVYPAAPTQLSYVGLLLAGTIRAEHYAELRQTYVYNFEDSLDSVVYLAMPFKIVSEMTDIVSVKVSFQILNFRAYSTATGGGGGQTTSASGADSRTTSAPSNLGGTDQTGALYSSYNTGSTDPATGKSVDSTNLSNHSHTMGTHYHTLSTASSTDTADLSTHTHGMGTHYHTVTGDTNTTNCAGTTHSHSLSSYSVSTNYVDPGDTDSANLSTHSHTIPSSGWTISTVDPGDTDNTDLGSHAHTIPSLSHDHTLTDHAHYAGSTIANHTHGVDITNHTHTVADHTHDVTYGIHEEANSPTISLYVDNGTGYGPKIDDYSGSQLDVDITSEISGTGWKWIKFTSTTRARIAAIIECKLDITA